MKRGGPAARPSLFAFDGGNDLLRCVVEVVGGDDVEAAVLDDLLAEFSVRAFEADDQRHGEIGLAHGGEHAG